jgi:hypothetical protein
MTSTATGRTVRMRTAVACAPAVGVPGDPRVVVAGERG